MSQMTLPKIVPPGAQHRGESDLPFVTFFEGLEFQLLQVSIENGLWVSLRQGEIRPAASDRALGADERQHAGREQVE
jgi:hypothetical protein